MLRRVSSGEFESDANFPTVLTKCVTRELTTPVTFDALQTAPLRDDGVPVVELKRVDDVGFFLEEENLRPLCELVDDFADELETTQRHRAELALDINCDKLEGLRDVVFRVFRVRLLRAFSRGRRRRTTAVRP